MDDEIGQYDMFCKYKQEFKRRHFSEEWKDLSKCKSIKNCLKRLPKVKKKYAFGHCRVETNCS